MSTAIEWTDETWNPVVGCDRISPGCAHCYAKTLHDKRHAAAIAGKRIAVQYLEPFETIQLKPDRLTEPLSWKRPRRVFVNSVSDLFHDDVPDAFLDRVFAVMALAPQHTFQILTKRADRMHAYLSDQSRHDAIVAAMDMPSWLPSGRRFLRVPEGWPLPNVWPGVSVENQRFADERIPLLLQTPAAVRFISAEPLLGPVNLQEYVPGRIWQYSPRPMDAPLDWVIVGGESGPGARPCALEWLRAIVAQCQAAGVPAFVKQLGTVPSSTAGVGDAAPWRIYGFRDAKGGDPAEWPEDLRVRAWPAVRA